MDAPHLPLSMPETDSCMAPPRLPPVRASLLAVAEEEGREGPGASSQDPPVCCLRSVAARRCTWGNSFDAVGVRGRGDGGTHTTRVSSCMKA